MLSETIMHECVVRLLRSPVDDESLECFARLITRTGKDLDHPQAKVWGEGGGEGEGGGGGGGGGGKRWGGGKWEGEEEGGGEEAKTRVGGREEEEEVGNHCSPRFVCYLVSR